MATPDIEVSPPIDDSLNSIHNNPQYKFLLELCQTNGVDLSEKDFEYFFKPISLAEMAEMAEMQITRDILEWIGYKGSVKKKYQSFERELINNNYTYMSKLPSNPISEMYTPSKNTVLMIVPKVDYHNVILQLSTAKAAHLRKILIQVFHKWQNFQNHPDSKAASAGSDQLQSLITTNVPAASYSGTPEVKRRKLSKRSSIPPFCMYYHNDGGMKSEISEFFQKVESCPYNAIALSETWLKDDCPNDKYFDSTKFKVYRKDRSSEETKLSTGGGVLFAIRSDYTSEEIKLTDVSGYIDQLCVRVEIPIPPFSKIINVYFFVSYIRSSSNYEVYEAHVKNFTDIVNLTKEKDENCYFVICGDFNVSDVKWYNSETIDSIMALNMDQKNDISNKKGNILDLMFVDSRLKANLKKASFKLLKDGIHHESLEIKFFGLSVLNKSKSLCNSAPKFDSKNKTNS